MRRYFARIVGAIVGVLFAAWPIATSPAAVFGHYPFDANYQDVSGNGKHGTLVDTNTLGNSGITSNAGAWVFGGGALDLSADRDFVAVPSKTFSSGIPYTIAFWARKAPGDTGDALLWDMVIGQRTNTAFFIGLNNGTGIRWRSSNSDANRQADFSAPDDTDWHHHAITADNAQNITYYLDGAWVATATGKLTGFIYDTIGEAYPPNRDFDFNGQIDEVWILDATAGAAEISNLYHYNSLLAPSTGVEAVLEYRFDGDYFDSSPAVNDGTPSGGAALTADTQLVAVGSGALLLDGEDTSYVALATTLQFGAATPWTAAFWAWRSETGAQKGMVMGERFTPDDFIWLNDNFTGLRFRSSSGQTLDFTVAKDTNLHHYALVAAGTGLLDLYVDGAWSQSLTGNTSFTLNTVGQAYTTSLHYAFSGVLDDVRVYRGALASSNVLALYQLRVSLPTSSVARVRVFLQGGQSNGDGRADPAGLPVSPVNLQQPQPDIDYYYRISGGVGTRTTLRPGTSETGQFGPEITFGRTMADLAGLDESTRVAIVKYANGATSLIADWKPGGDGTTAGDGPEYVAFQQTVGSGLASLAAAHPAAAVAVEGMIWMQGENDVPVSSTYRTNLQTFIADVRATYGTNLPFVVARLSANQTALSEPGLSAVRQAQTEVANADPWTGLVDTDPFPLKADALHFDADGQQQLGTGFAYAMLYLGWMTNRFTPAQIAGGGAEPNADSDGDGAVNGEEFVAGTDPGNAASVLKARLRAAGPPVFELSHPSATGRHYGVEMRTNATAVTWSALLPAEAGTGNPMVRPITNATPAAQFRVRGTLP